MAVSPLEIPGKILVRGLAIPNSKDFPVVIKRLVDKWQSILNAFGVEKLRPLQERIIYALESGLDLYITGRKHGGKTTAILIPILKNALSSPLEEEQEPATPFSIIFCESTQRGLELKCWLDHILKTISPSASLKVSFVDNVHNEAMLESITKQPLDILIFTGGALQELLTQGLRPMLDSLGLNYHRTRYVVFEEFGMKNFFSEKEALQFLHEVSDKSTGQTVLQRLNPNAQLIFYGTIWHNDYIGSVRKALCGIDRRSVMIFGSSFHALQYARSIIWKMDHLTSDKAKLNSLIGICKNMLVENRNVVVACSTSGVANTVSKYISENGGICNSVITWGNKGDTSGIFKRNMDWLGKVFIVSDDAWEEFEVYNLSCLVHFDIDWASAERKEDADEEEPFCSERYSCMWSRLERHWNSNVEPPGLTHFFLGGNEPNFLALSKFLQTANIPLPQSLKKIAEQRLKNELLKQPLCSNLKCFGYCNKINCPARHEISQEDLDTPADAPRHGELEFKVIESLNPSLYKVKLLNHYVIDEKTGERIRAKSYREEARNRIEEMMDYYSVHRNRVHPLKVSLGELFCIPFVRQPKNNDDNPIPSSSKHTMYLRGKLVGFVQGQLETSNRTDYAEMFCVDFGTTMAVSLADIMTLPEQFRRWSPHCIQAILSNLLYLEETKEYYSDALEAAKTLAEGKTWHGKVLLSLRDTIWVNPMVQYEPDHVTGHLTPKCNLLVELVKGRYASLPNSHKHMMIMMEYIRKRDPNYPEIEHEMNSSSCVNGEYNEEQFHKKGDPFVWEDLPISEANGDGKVLPMLFKIHSWITPWEIYGAVGEGHQECTGGILQLEQELTLDVERMEKGNRMKNFRKFAPLLEIGSLVSVKEVRKSRWQRGLILDKAVKDEEMCNRLTVFLVDYGSVAFEMKELEEVVPIRKTYVEMIPFQAICLKLSHIQPMGGSGTWGNNEMEQFSALVNSNNSLNAIAFVKVEETGMPCNYYEAMVYHDKLDETLIQEEHSSAEIGLKLVEKMCAETTPSLDRIISVVKSFSGASSNPGRSFNNSGDWSFSDEIDEGIYGDDVAGVDESGSDASLDRWRRFCDVEMDSGEYVAVIHDGPEGSFDNDAEPGPSNENTEGSDDAVNRIFDSVCEQMTGLTVNDEETQDSGTANFELNSDADDIGFRRDELDDEFFDAVDGDDENPDSEEVSAEEKNARSLFRQWFLRTL